MATNEKYDRQLRLWGAAGQSALSGTRVVLVNATAAGTETLKNLVLPGVGSFHVVDDRRVPPAGVGVGGCCPSNFFAVPGAACPPGCDDGDGEATETKEKKEGENDDDAGGGAGLGLSRARVACRFLLELNEDVSGSWRHVSPSLDGADFDAILRDAAGGEKKDGSSADDVPKNLLVVAADMSLRPLLRLASACWERDVPLIVVKSYGLIGSVRVQTRRHAIVESKPDTAPPDLRLAHCSERSFPELHALADSVDLDGLDDADHGHVPYVILLLKALDRWRSDHDGAVPKTFSEKQEFKKSIKGMSRDFDKELNFIEAADDAYLAYADRELPPEVGELLDAATIDDVRDGFDVLVLALRRFLGERDGGERRPYWPPLNGSIPDMTSSTSLYVKLQEAYKSRADADLARMRTLVDEILAATEVSGRGLEVSEEELVSFCKNVYNVQLLSTRSLEDELAHQTRVRSSPGAAAGDDVDGDAMRTEDDEAVAEGLTMACMDPSDPPEHTPLLWHVALRSCELFEREHGTYPGADSRELALESDAREVHRNMVDVAASLGLGDADLVKGSIGAEAGHAAEMVRYYNAELHNVASAVGGVASQEAVKLVTHQYVPIDNTFVYNGIAGTAAVYQF